VQAYVMPEDWYQFLFFGKKNKKQNKNKSRQTKKQQQQQKNLVSLQPQSS